MDLKQLSKDKLKELIDKHNIAMPEGKNKDRGPTNTELIAAIEEHNQLNDTGSEPAPLPKTSNENRIKKFSKSEQFKSDMTRGERVTVTDTQRFQSLDEEAPILIPVSFSNGIVDESRLVSTDGQPQYLPRCLINVLKNTMIEEWVQEGDTLAGITKPKRSRFIVTNVSGMSDEEIDAQKKRELVRAIQ